MNPKHENCRHLIVRKNTPISLSQLLGQKILSSNSFLPKRYIITLKPRSRVTNSTLKTNTAICDSTSEFHNIILNAAETYKAKSEFVSPCGLRKTILEKIDEQSEASVTSLQPKMYDLKLAKPSTEIPRLKGGCQMRRCKSPKRKLEEGSLICECREYKVKDLKCNELQDTSEKTKSESGFCTCGSKTPKEIEKAKQNSDIKEQLYRCECKEYEKSDITYQKAVNSNSEEIVCNKNDCINGCECQEKNLSCQNSEEPRKDEPLKLEAICDNNEHICKCQPQPKKSKSIYKCGCKIFKRKRYRSDRNEQKINRYEEIPNVAETNVEKLCYCQSLLNKPYVTQLNSDTCTRIDGLERQLDEMVMEIKDLRDGMLAPYDYLKIKFLSEQFREISELLVDLKINLTKVQDIQSSPESRTFLEDLQNQQQPVTDLCVAQHKIKNFLEFHKSFFDNYGTLNRNSVFCCNGDQSCSRSPASDQKFLPFETGYQCSYKNQPNQTTNSLIPRCEIIRNSQRTRYSCLRNCQPSNQNIEIFPTSKLFSPLHFLNNNNRRQSFGLDYETTSYPLTDVISRTSIFVELPVVTSGVQQSIWEIIGKHEPANISITLTLETNHLYHINVSILPTGQSLGCIYSTETAMDQAVTEHFFDNFTTFFVLNSNNSLLERNKMTSHSFGSMNSSS